MATLEVTAEVSNEKRRPKAEPESRNAVVLHVVKDST